MGHPTSYTDLTEFVEPPDAIDRKSPAAMVKGVIRAKIPGLAPYVRHYFELVADGGPGVIAWSAQVVYCRPSMRQPYILW